MGIVCFLLILDDGLLLDCNWVLNPKIFYFVVVSWTMEFVFPLVLAC
jgi:hypothetical protein